MPTCDLCDQPAVYHDVRIVDGAHNTVHLCQEHAIEAGLSTGVIDLSVVLHIPTTGGGHAGPTACPDCGLTIAQYKKTGLLGCPTCYETFQEQNEEDLTTLLAATARQKRESHVVIP